MWLFTASYLLVQDRWSHSYRPPEHLCTSDKPQKQASETSHSKSSLGNFQHQYLSEILVTEYSYRLMVKSVSSCCVHGSHLFLDPVTYRKNNWNIWEDEIFATTKLFYAKTYAAGRLNNMELLMLVLDFRLDYRLRNTRRYFCGMHGMS